MADTFITDTFIADTSNTDRFATDRFATDLLNRSMKVWVKVSRNHVIT
jgi:hypothetical protein